MVPFDNYYHFTVNAIATGEATNKPISIVVLTAREGSDNFFISSNGTQTKDNYTQDSGTGPTAIEVESSAISVTAQWSQISWAFNLLHVRCRRQEGESPRGSSP